MRQQPPTATLRFFQLPLPMLRTCRLPKMTLSMMLLSYAA
jgi:hypothetical protein